MNKSYLVGITIMLLVLPVAASDYTLGIFGNANEDGTINMQDVEYTERIILGFDEQTQLADAKYDNRINMQDVTQMELTILGREKELTFIDSRGGAVTVNKPVERIIALSDPHADAIRMLEADSKVVGVSSGLAAEKILLPVMSERPVIGTSSKPDPEAILSLTPDIVITYETWNVGLEEQIPEVTVVRLDISKPESIIEDLTKLGYILDKREKAEEFIDWYESYTKVIADRTEEIQDEDKTRVYLGLYPNIWKDKTMGTGSSGDMQCKITGGINVAGDLAKSSTSVDPEWIIEQNPDVVVLIVTSKAPSGYGVDDTAGVKAVLDDFTNRPEFHNLEAVKNERVYVIASDARCGIQMVISTAYWAKWFHPQLFTDLKPDEIQKEYLTRFQRVDYDIDEHGVFVYPPLDES
ncbi:MAG: ABC transporter substrate-binding protein [Deltaproteobacteria bacterium]|nr:ABC transporter substrate-binding protein [Deltaproteobacteria bacterium]